MRKRSPSDLTDEQWQLIQPLIPAAKSGGRPREVDMREVVNTLFYQARTGCQWDYLPHDLAPKSTAHDYFVAFGRDGTWQKIVDALRVRIRVQAGREATPSAACIDTQSVKTTEVGGEAGYDGHKKVKGRKRHLVVDAMGLLMAVTVTAANLDDGTHAGDVLWKVNDEAFPRLEVVLGDNKYNNRTLDDFLAEAEVAYRVEVAVRGDEREGFNPEKVRWVVEQAFAILGRCRRLSKDYERYTEHSETWIQISAIQQMLRRLHPDQEHPQPEFKYRTPGKNIA